MNDNWKVLRGGKELPQEEMPPAQSDVRDDVTTDRYGDPVNASSGMPSAQKRAAWPAGAVPTAEQPVPQKHFIIGFCVLVLVLVAWGFRTEVRGLAVWAIAKVQGKEVSLSAKAPGIGNAFRFGKEYTLEEFLTMCTEGTVASVTKILEKQPDLLKPKDGTTLLHMAVVRPINPEIFGLILERVGKEALNAKDAQGRTPLHIAATAPVPAGFILALRARGANIIVYDNEGKTPVDAFFESPLSKPSKITGEEGRLFREYGHTMNIPYSRDRNGNPRTEFVPLAEQVPEVEGKRYFTQLAQAVSVGVDAGAYSRIFASGDTVGPKRREMPPHEIQRAKIRGTYREPLPLLWQGVNVAPDTGTALARLKCLLTMAYPSSLNFFSARMAGDVKKPVYITEWNAWDVPAQVRMAIMMEELRRRMEKARPQMTQNKKGTFTFSGGLTMGYEVSRALRERGDDAAARNPLVMTWMLLEYGPALEATERPALLTNIDVALKGEKSGEDPYNGKELVNLRLLHDLLPKNVWRQVGRHLVAAAYTADKRRDGQWGAGLMPEYYRKNGRMNAIRLWACGEKSDSSEPLRQVLAETGNVSPELAKAMVALVLRSGPESTVRDKNGKTPVEYAKEMGVSPAVIALVGKKPVYEPPAKPAEKDEKAKTETQSSSPATSSGKRPPSVKVKSSTI